MAGNPINPYPYPTQRFQDDTVDPFTGRKLSWGMCQDLEGLPVAGDMMPHMRRDEYQYRLVQIEDPVIKLYNLTEPAHRQEYSEALKRILSGAARLLDRRWWVDPLTGCPMVYLEFAVQAYEDVGPRH